jgi:two-component system, NtrC family, sensor histidine kinase KinB
MSKDETRVSLQLLLETSRELVTSLDLDVVLARVLMLSTRAVGAERGTLIVLDDHLKPVNAAIVYNQQVIPHTEAQLLEIIEHGLAGWVIHNRHPVLITDTSHDERWLQRPDDALDRTGPKSAICLPIMMAGDNLVGVLTIVYPATNFFKPDHVDLLQAIGDQAGFAMYNAQLYQSLQEAHARYRALFEDSIDPIFITNWQGQILEANRRATQSTGYLSEELPHHTIQEFHTLDVGLLGEGFANLKEQTTIRYESELKPRNGITALPVEVYVHKVRIEEEDYLQWILRDISERKALDSLRDELIAMIYHDLRSPLSNVISSLDMLQMLLPADGDPNIQSVFQITTRSTERLKRLINSLLDIHRLQAGQPITNLESISPTQLAAEALDTVRPTANNKGQALENHLAEGLPALQVDVDMIKRVLINLLENAGKFSPSGGTISVGGMVEGSWMRFWVQDSGPGIPEKARKEIFERFVRLQTDGAPRGIGLGLAFCKLAVEAHGGKIWVDSGEKQGSCFIFTIPLAQK